MNRYQDAHEEQNENIGFTNRGYSNIFMDANSLQIRLDTENVLKDLQSDLQGIRERYKEDEQGNIIVEEIKVGDAYANKKGVQAIMSYTRSMVNHINVQGNFKEDSDYEDYLVRARKDFATELMISLNAYGISKEDYHSIISRVFRLVELFATRPINAGDRNAISQNSSYIESNVIQNQKKRSFPFFNK